MDYYIKNNIRKENNQSAEVSGDDRGPPAWTLRASCARDHEHSCRLHIYCKLTARAAWRAGPRGV